MDTSRQAQTDSATTKWSGFLSSLVGHRRSLREKIYELTRNSTFPIYVDECVKKRKLEQEDPLEIADELIAKIREAPVFICILEGQSYHGSPIKVDSKASTVSFLEVELYQASLLNKPIHVFQFDNFAPEPRLAGVLDMLEFALPRNAWHRISGRNEAESTKQMLDTIPALLSKPVPKRRRSLRYVLRDLVYQFWKKRGRQNVLFLDSHFESPSGHPDVDMIHELLGKARAADKDHEQRLTRVWIAIRELMKSPYTDVRHKNLRPLWDEVLGRWTRSATWYGLHGHIYLGTLAALNTMANLRKSIREEGNDTKNPAFEHPGGALASAHYSIARKLGWRYSTGWVHNMKMAEHHINLNLAEPSQDPSGLLAIRGSIHLRLGRFRRAVSDYREVLAIRERRGDSPAGIGQAMSELGFAYLFQLRLTEGRRLLNAGAALLQSQSDTGFLIRAIKKRRIANLLTLHWRDALADRHSAESLAHKHKYFDQLT